MIQQLALYQSNILNIVQVAGTNLREWVGGLIGYNNNNNNNMLDLHQDVYYELLTAMAYKYCAVI